MNRRTALTALILLPLGYFRAFAAESGWLTVDLGDWKGVKVRLNGKEIAVTNVELFDALKEKP